MKKVLPWVVSVILALGMVYQHLQMKEIERAVTESNEVVVKKLHSFDEALGRANTKIDSSGRLLEAKLDEIPADIRREIEDFKAEVVTIASATVRNRSTGGGRVSKVSNSSRRNRSSSGGTVVRPRVTITPGTVTVEERDSSAVGQVRETIRYKDWRLLAELKGDEFRYELDQSFDVTLVELEHGQANPTYLRVWELGPDGKRMEPPLTVSQFDVIRRQKSSTSFHLFNPKIDVAVVGVWRDSITPSGMAEVGISMSTYGDTRDDSRWRFLRLSGQVSEDGVGVGLCPASYNVGKHLPVVSNVWLSPCYSYNGMHGGGVSVGGVL